VGISEEGEDETIHDEKNVFNESDIDTSCKEILSKARMIIKEKN